MSGRGLNRQKSLGAAHARNASLSGGLRGGCGREALSRRVPPRAALRAWRVRYLALCSHLLFLYSEQFDADFHSVVHSRTPAGGAAGTRLFPTDMAGRESVAPAASDEETGTGRGKSPGCARFRTSSRRAGPDAAVDKKAGSVRETYSCSCPPSSNTIGVGRQALGLSATLEESSAHFNGFPWRRC